MSNPPSPRFPQASRMTAPARAWLRTHRTAVLRTGIALVALYALYLIAANVFLSSGLSVAAFNRKPQRFQIHWQRAWSLYPGHIHATDVRVDGHSRRNRWTSTSPAVDGRIKLLPLLARRLSFGNIDASDVSFAISRKAPYLKPSISTSRWPAWRLHFDGIRTDSPRAIRMDDWVVDAFRDAHASFAMNKILRGGKMEILPSTLTARSARITYGKSTLLRDARLDFTMTMAPNSHRQAQGFGRLRFIDARLQLSGQAPGLAMGGEDRDFLSFATGKTGGRAQADIAIKRGVLVPGGSLRWSAPILLKDGVADPGPERLQLLAKVEKNGVAVRATVPRRTDRPDFIDANLRIAERDLRAMGGREMLRKASGEIALLWHFRTLRWLNPLLSEGGWLRLDGQADVNARLRVRNGHLAPGSRAEIARASVQADLFDTVLSGQARALAVVDAKRTTVDFVAERFHLAPRDLPDQPYVEGSNLKLGLVASEDLSQFRRTLKAHLLFDDARIPKLQAYNRNLPGKSLRLDGGSGTLGADLRMDAQGRVQSGRLRLRGTDAQVVLGPSRILGNLAVDTRITQSGKDARSYRIDALELALDNVRVGEPGQAPWWAKLSVDNGTLQWKQPFAVQGDARLVMKDVSVLLTLFSQRSAFPKWIGSLIDVGQVNATAHVATAGDTVSLQRLHASNARVDLDAHLRIANGRPKGGLYAKWGPLGVAAELDGDQRKIYMKDAKARYEALGR